MVDDAESLEKDLDEINEEIRKVKERQFQELRPFETDRRNIRNRLGIIYAGFQPDDILVDGKGRKVRVTEVYSAYRHSWDARGINLRNDGTEGQERLIHSYQGFIKQA